MRTLVHLSDLHFGRIDPALIEPLLATVAELEPDLVVVSGDLTQRARKRAVRGGARLPRSPAAAADRRAGQPRRAAVPGLGALPQPARQVPPHHRGRPRAVLRRRRDRRRRHQHGALADLQGRAHQRGADGSDPAPLRRRSANGDQGRRHPPPVRSARPEPATSIWSAARARRWRCSRAAASTCCSSGHFHVSEAGATAARHEIAGYSALVVQAGTATSTRGRGEENSFNVLRVRDDEIVVERMSWRDDAKAFAPNATERFVRDGARWIECR